MGANAQTTVPTFTASQVLTADQQNQSARTGVPVFATTVTRDAAFGGSGEKTLAEGQLAYIEATDVVQYYDGTSWATLGPASAGGLVLISATTIGSAVASVTVSSAFSSTYDNYKILISGGAGSTDHSLNLTLGATATGYYLGQSAVTYSTGATSVDNRNNASSWIQAGDITTTSLGMDVDLLGPNLAKKTYIFGARTQARSDQHGGYCSGFLDNTTQYTAFTVTAGSGTLTGGTIRVYGYANS